ncbi:MAG: endonuclease [Odoribacter sp.]|nr:endonuclease [Odoribacter sp.]
MKRIFAVTLFITASLYLNCQDLPSAKNSLTFVFYNVENLFDIVNDPDKNDEEFLPESPMQWNAERYSKKITDLAKVLSSINEKELPALVGLAEVENQKTLEDLIASPKLKKGKYGFIHYDSKDERGIDVALLYDKDEIELLDSKAIPVVFGIDIQDATRDILYVKCKIKDDNIFHVFINHWPSRSPNEQESEIKRITAAIALRKEVDNILNFENNARIVIMGDFNDEPTNRSVMQILNAANKRKNLNYRDLFNLMYDPHNINSEGSITYRDNWQMFDQIIVSPVLLNKGTGYYLSYGDGKVYKGEEVISVNPQTKLTSPSRTYGGNSYLGGVSDHLPVYIILKKEVK